MILLGLVSVVVVVVLWLFGLIVVVVVLVLVSRWKASAAVLGFHPSCMLALCSFRWLLGCVRGGAVDWLIGSLLACLRLYLSLQFCSMAVKVSVGVHFLLGLLLPPSSLVVCGWGGCGCGACGCVLVGVVVVLP